MIKYRQFMVAGLFATALVSGPAVAADLDIPVIEAAPSSSAYIAGRIGITFAEDSEFDLNAAAAVPTGIENDYDGPGFTGALALGYEFDGGLRGEIEVSYLENDIDAHTIVALPATLSGSSAFGETEIFTGLVNGYYDIDLGTLDPFVSAGIGYSHVEFDNHGVVIPAGGVAGLPGGPITVLDDDDEGFTWQLGAGAGVELSETTTMEFGYRFQRVEDVSLTAVDGTQSDVDFDTHSVTTGLRFNF